MRANIVGPQRAATSISASIAACHSGASCSRFGSLVMNVAASRSVISGWGSGMGSSKARCQPRLLIWLLQLVGDFPNRQPQLKLGELFEQPLHDFLAVR